MERLQRSVVDVNVRFRCRVRAYAGAKARIVEHEFRVVAVRRPNGTYAIYATNAPVETLAAEDIWSVYRLRWEVETFFKTAKSGCALSDTPCRDRHRVLAFVYAAVVRAAIAMRARARFVRLVPARNQERFVAQPLGELGLAEDGGGLGCEPPVEQSRVGVATPYGGSRAVPLNVMGATAFRDGRRTALPGAA